MGDRHPLLKQALSLLYTRVWLCRIFLGNFNTKMRWAEVFRLLLLIIDNRCHLLHSASFCVDLNNLKLPHSLGMLTLGTQLLHYEEAKQPRGQDMCSVLCTTVPDEVPIFIQKQLPDMQISKPSDNSFQPPGIEIPSVFMPFELSPYTAVIRYPFWVVLQLQICEQNKW